MGGYLGGAKKLTEHHTRCYRQRDELREGVGGNCIRHHREEGEENEGKRPQYANVSERTDAHVETTHSV